MLIKNRNLKLNGSITLFLCLIFTILLSFIMLMLELSRTHMVKAHVEGISHIALESAMGYFSLPLYENYGLFAVSLPDSSITPLIDEYIERNLSLTSDFKEQTYDLCKISSHICLPRKFYHLTDSNGEIFINQIIRYMKYASASDISDIILQAPFIDLFSKDYVDISSINPDENTVDTDISLSELSNDISNTEVLSEQEALSKRNSIFTRIKELLTKASLSIYIDKSSNISARQTDTSKLPSSVCSYNRTSSISSSLSESEKILFLMYLSDTFNCYTSSASDTKELRYQFEYLINGDSDDEDNLLQCILKIQSLRTGLNLAYLYTDSEKRQAARTLASAAVGLIPVPFLVEFTQLAILSAWASAETIVDIRDLLKGGKIPLFKSKSSWTLDLDDILTFDYNTGSKNSDNGLSYKQYLQLCLYVGLDTSTVYRAMDLIQMDIRKNYYSEFKMTECITGLIYSFDYNYHPVFYIGNSQYKKSSLFNHSFIQSYGY